jgi:hypothetical protein
MGPEKTRLAQLRNYSSQDLSMAVLFQGLRSAHIVQRFLHFIYLFLFIYHISHRFLSYQSEKPDQRLALSAPHCGRLIASIQRGYLNSAEVYCTDIYSPRPPN